MSTAILSTQVERLLQPLELPRGRRQRIQFIERFPAEFANELVGVAAARKLHDPCGQVLFRKHVKRPCDGLLTRAIAVIRDAHLRHVPLNQRHLFRRKRGAERSHHAGNALLHQRGHVHVAFDQYQSFALALFFHDVQSEQLAPFIEHYGIGCVQVFRLCVAHDPAAEAHYAALRVDYGEHHAASELVVDATVAFAAQSGHVYFIGGKALLHQFIDRRVALKRGCAQAESAYSLVVQPALMQISEGLRAFVAVQQRMIVQCRGAVTVVHPLALLRGYTGFIARGHFGYFEIHAVGEQPCRVHKFHVFHFHYEIEHVAALMAAEAVKHLRPGIDLERGRFFIMEGTASPMAMALRSEGHIIAHHVHDVNAIAQSIDPIAAHAVCHVVS